MTPKVTILLATFNRAHLLLETLDSILAQTYLNWECIIVDDHSIDSTKQVIEEYIIKDNRFSYFLKTEQYKRGLSGTRNCGLDIAVSRKAQFIQFFDDDDIMHPKKLELQMAPFFNNQMLHLTICKFELLHETEKGIYCLTNNKYQIVASHLGEATLTGEIMINSLSTLWKMEILNQFRFDEDLDFAEEWELYTRIGYNYPYSFEVVDEYLFKYRKHKKSLTLDDDSDFSRRKTSAIIRIKIFDYLTTNRLHTTKSILFLARTFLTSNYHPNYVGALLKYVNQNEGFSVKLKYYLKTTIYISKFYNKVIGKLATWV